MRLLPRSTRSLLPVVPAMALMMALSGCSFFSGLMGPGKDEFAPPCPRASLVRDLADITRFRTEASRDLTEMVVQGRVLAIGGDCRLTEKRGTTVETTVTVSAEFTRGPAMRGRTATVPMFIALTEGDTVLDKQVIEFPVEFPANVDRAALQSQPVRLLLPTTRTKSPAAFNIIAGFQLTPAELATNKQRATGR